MKRHLLAFVAALAVACLALSACAAANSPASSSPASSSSEESPFVGTWEIVSQEKVRNEDLEVEKSQGRSRFFILSEDGTARSEYQGKTTEGSYKLTGKTIATLETSDPQWGDKMTIEEKLLVVEGANGLRYRFQKTTEEDRLRYDADHGFANTQSNGSSVSSASGTASGSASSGSVNAGA